MIDTPLNSEITFDEKERRILRIKDGEFSIIYLSPELFLANAIDSIIGDRKIGLIVIDEAHLVTTWGRDFRADYLFLGDYIDKLRSMTDFTDKDMKYVRMLYGLSSMRQYQLKEMMRKLYQIYKDKGSRNFLVSPEAFSYMFNETEVENKVKNGLLLISKLSDITRTFWVGQL